jgi:hypothetical protein
MNAVNDRIQAVLAEMGLALDREYPAPAPFNIIRCPLCGGTDFVTIEMSSVWCRCNARFEVTAMREGSFTCVLTWRDYWPTATRYILPMVEGLRLLLNLEAVRGDPRDLAYDPALCGGFDACQPGSPWLTGDDDVGLRPGLHKCRVLGLYDWRFWGRAPSPADISWFHKSWDIDGDDDPWPQCACVRRVELNETERWHLEIAALALSRLDVESLRETVAVLDDLKGNMGHNPIWVDAPLPPVSCLQDGEYYMLHHWLTECDDRGQRATCAWPIWYVVKPVPRVDDLNHVEEWQVVRGDVCPVCGHQVAEETLAQVDEPSHAGCRGVWDKTSWQPVSSEAEEVAHEKTAIERAALGAPAACR